MPSGMSPEDALEYMTLLRDEFRQQFQELATSYTIGDITAGDFQVEARALLRSQYAQAMVMGAGGDPDAVANSDYLSLGPQLKSQYGYLEDFVKDIESGDLSDAQITARAGLYGNSAMQAFWIERAPFALPQLPGDGNTQCLTNCKCHWEFDMEYDAAGDPSAVLCTWTLSDAEHCPDCEENSKTWNPLRVPVGPDFDEGDLAWAKERHFTFPQLEQLWMWTVAVKVFNPDQPRDEHGRWTSGGGEMSGGSTGPVVETHYDTSDEDEEDLPVWTPKSPKELPTSTHDKHALDEIRKHAERQEHWRRRLPPPPKVAKKVESYQPLTKDDWNVRLARISSDPLRAALRTADAEKIGQEETHGD